MNQRLKAHPETINFPCPECKAKKGERCTVTEGDQADIGCYGDPLRNGFGQPLIHFKRIEQEGTKYHGKPQNRIRAQEETTG